MSLRAIIFEHGRLLVLDQLKLPHETEYIEIHSTEDAHRVIRTMSVRGAPAIAIVGMLGVSVDLAQHSGPRVIEYALSKLDYIVTARPTAVNLANAASDMRDVLKNASDETAAEVFMKAAQEKMNRDVQNNMDIGKQGLQWYLSQFPSMKTSVITICNTGSLATAGYGTALGIIRSLHKANKLNHVYALETRPYNQGARLTAYELVHDKIPATLITDSMAASLMRTNKEEIKLVIVGADRVVANGDTANKIGTYQLAVLARFHGIKFVVAAPHTTLDFETSKGDDIQIEQRPAEELTHINGQRIAASDIDVWNPAFDVTPYELIDAIITEKGVWKPEPL